MRSIQLISAFLFCLLSNLAFGQVTISRAEYFLDTDPGIGLAVPISITNGTSIDMEFNIPTGSLPEGFHTLTVRVQDDSLEWSMLETRPFWVEDALINNTERLEEVEYFIDDEPGIANGVSASAFAPAQAVDFEEKVPTSSLDIGFHKLSVRTRDSLGAWSVIETRPFYVTDQIINAIDSVVAMEYFIDSDPGPGQGTDVVAFSSDVSSDLEEIVPTISLTPGFHTFSTRTQDANGVWGVIETRPFYVTEEDITDTAEIIAAEYYFDSDPGIGNAIELDLMDGVIVDTDSTFMTSSLEPGFHTLAMRVLSADSLWSTQETRGFYVDEFTSSKLSLIESFVAPDSGYGQGDILDIADTLAIDTCLAFDISSMDTGSYTLGFRFMNEDSTWSIPEYHTVLITLDPCIFDSMALVEMHNRLDGDNWSNATNWLTGPISSWEGIGLNGCRIDSVNLNGQGLTGELGNEMQWLSAMRFLDLSDNNLTDSVPSSILGDTSLQVLNLQNNNFSNLSDLDSLPYLSELRVQGNSLDFGDLEQLSGAAATLIASPQDSLGIDTTLLASSGDSLTLFSSTSGTQNIYQWLWNGDTIPGATQAEYKIKTQLADSGQYDLVIGNALLPGVLLYQRPITVQTSGVANIDLTLPSGTLFCPNDSLLLIAPSADGYQWFYEGDTIVGATDSFYYAKDSGDYYSRLVFGAGSIASQDTSIVQHMMSGTTAGFDLDLCTNSGLMMNANSPALLFSETGQWIIGADDSLSSLTDPNAFYFKKSGQQNDSTILIWEMTDSSGNCTTRDSVIIKFAKEIAFESYFDSLSITDTTGSLTLVLSELIDSTISDSLNYTVLSSIGDAQIVEDTLIYTPLTNQSGHDTIKLVACYSCGLCDTSTVVINTLEIPLEIDPVDTTTTIGDSLALDLADFIVNPNGDLKQLFLPDSGLAVKTKFDALAVIDFEAGTITLFYEVFAPPSNEEIIYDSLNVEICKGNNVCTPLNMRITLNQETTQGEVKVFNAVSANGDFRNDYLFIEHTEDYPGMVVKIYNRSGDKVFQTDTYTNNVFDTDVCFRGIGNHRSYGGTTLTAGVYFITVAHDDFEKTLTSIIMLTTE